MGADRAAGADGLGVIRHGVFCTPAFWRRPDSVISSAALHVVRELEGLLQLGPGHRFREGFC
ncbi:hypothetical protein AVL59_33030 [Streptomyces griseochromogenes]|uniref:Uncharacterized protein n=1 Tax=Streptomyces griseochromogenes TaxID=68214 RepID=A0A1B1B4I7_9ACTN|nr:hypothetical protein AVL59_33030 [Streptomyces griseochromogenes]